MSAATLLPERTRRRVQLLAHSPALRTALRRAFAAAGSDLVLSLESTDPQAGSGPAGEMRPTAHVLDTDLPGMRGLGLLRQIAGSDPNTIVVVVAPDTAEGRAMRTEALEKGAASFILKPAVDEPLAYRPIAEEITRVLRGKAPPPRANAPRAPERPARMGGREAAPPSQTPRPRLHRAPPQVLVVASSTGGPQALITLFSKIPAASVTVPVLIVQHMPAAFTPILAEHLSRATSWRAVEATNDEALTSGEIRIAPGGHHMIVAQSGACRRLKLIDTPPVNFCRPSADVLFVSAAEVFGRGLLAVILTGMGNDGCEGAKVIAAAGGAVFAQDRETSVVWGMPGAAVAAGVVDKVFPLTDIPAAVQAAMQGVF
ncbi:chemotaxis protein CheB [Acuticoccus kandeliae]|uniref:chemotaxis protein CheB n=1 Tax=Acuticoccus kandeliae TaxID=2073160 RepID=UPI000D3E02C1|nr:chemotaxis protein CheB [Acuticoccus kandeliae]